MTLINYETTFAWSCRYLKKLFSKVGPRITSRSTKFREVMRAFSNYSGAEMNIFKQS